ncbi:MAG: universal stress protein [Bacteroidetes bacterium]|nr:universal stress protein [Bacteroidota bacterium]
MHILVPCDFSNLSNLAFQSAVKLAECSNGTVTLLHVIAAGGDVLVDISGNLIETSEMDLSMVRSDMDIARARIDSMIRSTGYANVDFKVLPGQIEEVVTHETTLSNYDLVIMGTHGAYGLKELFIGSHTEHIAMKSRSPVLAIKSADHSFANIVFASSFSEPVLIPHVVLQFQKCFNATLHLLNVETKDSTINKQEVSHKMNKVASNYHIPVDRLHIVPAFDVETGIENFCTEQNVGLVAMETKGRTGINRWINGSISAGLVNHTPYALLTFKQ